LRFAFGRVRDDVLKVTRNKQEPFVYGSLGGDTISIVPPVPEPPRPRLPEADEVGWGFLKESSDTAALAQFIDRFPTSAFRAEAEARLAALKARSTPSPPGLPPDEITWEVVKGSREPDQLRRFIAQFPQSSRQAEAEQRIAALSAEPAEPKPAPAPQIDQREIGRALQLELKRVGCFDGRVDGEFGPATRTALRNFAKFAALNVPDDDLTLDAVKAVRGFDRRICPLVCPSGERADGERCIRIVCGRGQVLKNDACVDKVAAEPKRPARPEPAARPQAVRPSGGSRCFSFQGRQFCE
jgi:hypothetical protein